MRQLAEALPAQMGGRETRCCAPGGKSERGAHHHVADPLIIHKLPLLRDELVCSGDKESGEAEQMSFRAPQSAPSSSWPRHGLPTLEQLSQWVLFVLLALPRTVGLLADLHAAAVHHAVLPLPPVDPASR